MKRDLALLYSQLNLPADCSLEELQRAYRHRIAELHPDRNAGRDSVHGAAQLQELIWLYAAALRFHRRHGRLPGARVSGRVVVASRPAPSPAPGPHAPAGFSAAATARAPLSARADDARRRTTAWAIALVVALLILAMVWEHSTPPAPAPAGSEQVAARTAPAPAAGKRLELGMDEGTVRAIQGEPMQVNNTRWDYGPSWLLFEDGRLVDWHSSPLHELKTATRSPPHVAAK